MVISAANRAGPGCAEPESSAAAAKLSGRMRASLPPLGPPVSRDRIIASFPKWYTPAACLQLKEHFHGQVNAACQRRNTGTVGLSLSKAVVVGDLHVGKTSLIHRFCKNVFDHDYKATIGVDFEIERFEIAGMPYSLQIWDTAGQEKFKCIASAYYRGAQVIITAFDLTDVQTLEHTRRWLEDALRENEPGSCFIFLVGTKKDLLSRAACEQAEGEAVHLANELQAEYWSVSAKTGENVSAFFSRVAALAFEQSVLQALERRSGCRLLVGDGDLIRAYRPRGRRQAVASHPPPASSHPPPTFLRHSDPRPAASQTLPASSDPLAAPLSAGQSPHGQAGHPGSTVCPGCGSPSTYLCPSPEMCPRAQP
ncbi:ras-related protein Rab-36 isoform X1 [Myotis daubentonii]|uniref:ras-related protein Rab-36 isoform X1 n=1 Tax=Myotis daubentonii TaxID=98922 RepID=UPI002872CFF5|nr:ras-related protein Rab-36 isoform X1 [Myotis daubentonii]